ncbi:hypothetical protein LF41_3035 [Lysobacter dokdonensis DS-58]|uniref:Uncharacterized protein n=1 Tax=Lysobacter dokdonensis DS-58 TaxID=1300345 RepID=A0A0A2WM71_9GAMM|nr:hypothetical protein [Lysobacter dokdonensis]KGQ19385.1 hypothetical protein LF41_3035 [Lysobacter dokdonensis DS-58]
MADEDANTGHDDADLAGEWYADRFRIGHNAFEFKVDCGHEKENGMTPVYLRVIANPVNARELFRQLGVGLLRHADRFGRDDDPDGGDGGP